jgi:hypothetical protein
MELIVKIKNVYGADLVYAACEKSELLLGLTGQKTFSPHHITKLKKLGYTLVIQSQELAA